MELKEVLVALRKHLWLIAIVVLISCLATALYSFNNATSIYRASAKLLINYANQNNGTASIDINSINTNIRLINSYKEIILSEAILNKVAEANPDLNMTGKQLMGSVAAGSSEDSQIMTVTVYNENYQTAVRLTNEVAETFRREIPNIMKLDNVTILTPADPNAPPVNLAANPMLNVLLAFLLSSMLAVGIVVLRNYLDDSVKSEADIEKTLGYPTLSVIQVIRNKDLKPQRRKDFPSQPSHKAGEQPYAAANR